MSKPKQITYTFGGNDFKTGQMRTIRIKSSKLKKAVDEADKILDNLRILKSES